MYEINVEEIMRNIRTEIAEKGYSDDEMSYMKVLANMDTASMENRFQAKELQSKYEYISTHYANPVYFPLKGNPIKCFLQRALRRVLLFVIFPAFQYQNMFNHATVNCIHQLKNHVDETKELKKQLAQQQEQIQQLQQELAELKKA